MVAYSALHAVMLCEETILGLIRSNQGENKVEEQNLAATAHQRLVRIVHSGRSKNSLA